MLIVATIFQDLRSDNAHRLRFFQWRAHKLGYSQGLADGTRTNYVIELKFDESFVLWYLR
jgi:hypothetical protein